MAKEIKVSIVIPIYNVAPYIKECIQSVMGQMWNGELECILVDDCGTDGSMSIVEKMLQTYEGNIEFRIVHHNQNRGLSAARNTGIETATGDYIYFLDSDDEISPDCIERLACPLQQRDYDFVVGDYRLLGSSQQMDPLRMSDGETLLGDEVLRAYRVKRWYLMSVNKLYHVSFLNRHHLRFYEGIIHEDELWSFHIACLAQSVYAVGHVTYIYKIREGSITVNKDHERRCYCINVILREMSVFANKHHLREKKDVYNLIQNFSIITLSSICSEACFLFPQFYREQRKNLGVNWKSCFLIDGMDIRKQLRDLHLLFPTRLAIPYLKLLFHFL